MKIYALVVALLLSVSTFAQNNKIGLSVSPNYAYRTNQDNNPSIGSPINEIPKLGYRFTANYERSFHKRASFFTGLAFINNGYKTEEFELKYSDIPQANPPKYRAVSYRTNIYQIGIPIGVHYFIPIKKVRFFLGAGASINYLLSLQDTRVLYTLNNETEKSTSNIDKESYKPLSFASFVNFGIAFNLSENYTMRISPNIHYTLTNIMSDKSILKVYPTSSGINFGVYRQL